nr:salicylate synthase [Kibdelosporangium sp. MJ126-NF4]CEL12930.1 iron aquisition yersiniabactin synthesis enzyme (Irp2) [Kibdelosporangium sp. MJ126-NF4]CTQ98615.1 iron aquisition yersiniabactin synthesis enzyme (Irp2) [Kibdelosporangium sp. MJ126-NF4]
MTTALDPLLTAAALARRATPPFIVYERDRQWAFASGARAELRMNRHGITLSTASAERRVPVGDDPLQQVSRLLQDLPMPAWRAYGWAGFELSMLLQGMADRLGDETLMHLVIPQHEVIIGPCGVELSGLADLDDLEIGSWARPATELEIALDRDESYLTGVAHLVGEIQAGRLQKAILSRVVPVPGELDLAATYVAGRRGNTPARSFLLDLGGLRATGFSPETVVEVAADGWVSTQPLAGTRELTGDPVADLARRVELLGDPKEIFEHAISVRLAQDELLGICCPDSVRVDEFMTVRERGSVQHLASRASGRLAVANNAWHAFAALFPAITASGVPKRAAIEAISRLEQRRGLYSGAVLALDSDGALDAALVLRTVFNQDGRTWLRAGAGVVAMSTPEREWVETCEKLRSISRFLVPRDQGGLNVSDQPDLTAAGLRRTAAELTEEDVDSIDPDTNLFALGLESIALMNLVSTWRRAGIEVNFAELAENPTLGAWEKLLAERRPVSPAAEVPEDETAAGGDEFPLAVLQHAYWIGRSTGQRLGGVAAHLYTEFDGSDVDQDRLRQALERLVERHDMLRVVITDNGRQRVAETSGWRGLTVHDLREAPAAEGERRLAEIRDVNSHQMLDIENGEVFATALSLLPDGRSRLHVDVDMVAADAVSYRIMLADLATFYATPDADLPRPRYSYRQYREAHPQSRREAAAKAQEWWQHRLSTLPGAPDLPRAIQNGDRPPRVARRAIHLSAAERDALAEAARTHGLTTAMAVATAFAETIGAWSSESRFLLNVPLFDREPLHEDVGRIVGDFTSSVLLEIDLSQPAVFADRVRRVQSRMHSDTAHAEYSGVEVLRDLTRARGEQVLAPVVFTSALNLGELFAPSVQDKFGTPAWIISQGPQVLLDAQVTELGGGLLVNWDSRDDEFADGVVDAMFDAFAALIKRLAADPEAWIAPVPELALATQRERREEINTTDAPRSHQCLHSGFFAMAAATPENLAVIDAETCTYGELADRALRVAAALVAQGIKPGDSVGVTMPKGADQVVAVLGVLAAGAAYVPIGVDQPQARAERIAALAGVQTILGPGPLPTAEPLSGPVGTDEDQLAYILFTSGSTGEPKGVEVPHRAAMSTIDDLTGRFGIGPADRTLALSALDFDLSVFDLFAPLSTGGAVVMVADDRRDATAWAELVAAHQVTILNCVPQLLDMLLSSGVALGTSLRAVLLGGDWVGVDLPGRLTDAVPGCRFAGLGGTTETAIHSTICEVDGPVPADWKAVPYGTPLRGVRCRVVDVLGRDCPDWVAGELWIGGDGVARGYRGDPDRTADRFVEHDGLRWYRTGDLARYRGDGTLEFLGRRDNQVKIRGFRIELGEVEAALLSDPDVTAAVAVVVSGALAAGIVTTQADVATIKDRVRTAVPAHMVPERIVLLDRVPLTANGKVDRRAVEAAVRTVEPGVGPAPSTPLERVVERVWCEVLGVDSVGADREFFAVGGDSVLATAIVALLRSTLDTRSISVRSLFAAPTIAGFAANLARGQENPGRLEAVAELFWQIEAMTDDEVRQRAGADS